MKRVFPILILLTFLFNVGLSQSKMTVTGDSLVGKVVNGEKLRVVIGNVVISDSKAQVTCEKAVQHLQSGDIDLFGNVVFVQDTLKLFTERAYYFSNEKIGVIDTNLLMITLHDSVEALYGKYFFDENTARFYGEVRAVTDGKILKADTLFYFREKKKMRALGNVFVKDSLSLLYCDTLDYDENLRATNAFGRVYIKSKERNSESIAEVFIDSALAGKTILRRKPIAMQIDSADNGVDTMIVAAEELRFIRDSSRTMIARDSVKIIRGDFALRADSAFFNIDENFFTAYKKNERKPVVLWFEKTQIYGDTIFVTLENNKVKEAEIRGEVSLIESVDTTSLRYNQISGEIVHLYFSENKLQRMTVAGKVLDIYYLAGEEATQGLIKSSSASAEIVFDSSGVAKVKLFGNPKSEFHPENLISGKERDFLLPSFKIFKNKPAMRKMKEKIVERKKILNVEE